MDGIDLRKADGWIWDSPGLVLVVVLLLGDFRCGVEKRSTKSRQVVLLGAALRYSDFMIYAIPRHNFEQLHLRLTYVSIISI